MIAAQAALSSVMRIPNTPVVDKFVVFRVTWLPFHDVTLGLFVRQGNGRYLENRIKLNIAGTLQFPDQET